MPGYQSYSEAFLKTVWPINKY